MSGSVQLLQNVLSVLLNREKCFINDTVNTFYLRLYGVRHMVKDHSDSEKAT